MPLGKKTKKGSPRPRPKPPLPGEDPKLELKISSHRDSSDGDFVGRAEPRQFYLLPLVVALVGLIGTIVVARTSYLYALQSTTSSTQTAAAQATETPMLLTTVTTEVRTGRVEGILTDRTGYPISDLSLSILNGPETKTDIEGKFALNDVQEGERLIIVKPPSGNVQFTLNISVIADQTNAINLVYDAATSRLGLLSIVAPVNGGELEVSQDIGGNNETIHRASIFGRCDGLAQIFQNEFEIWVLVRSERDGRFWVQFPAATIDPNDNTWRANVVLGDAKHPPLNGEKWTIIAVAAELDSGFDNILNTPRLSLLPPHVTSNIVIVDARIK